MINLLVDESYAFDYLSILLTKESINDNEQNKSNANICSDFIESQIGKELMLKIIVSPEFRKLNEANRITYQLVEKIRYQEGGKVTGKDVDNANMDRYYAKKELQKKFFNTDITEKKS